MVLDTLKEQKEFTNSEKMIAQFILQHMNEIGGMTVIQLADQSYTSKASVIRLCKKLGFQKYQDFRQQIVLERQEVNKKKRVAFVISFTGSNSGMIHTAKFLSEHGVFIVGLGGEDSEELRKVCHEFIQIDTKKNIMSMEVITSITSANYIIDVIFTSLIVDHYQENLEAAIEIWKMRQK